MRDDRCIALGSCISCGRVALQVLGTLALYHREPTEPSESDREQVRRFAMIVSYVIEKHIESVIHTSGSHPIAQVTLH